MYKLKNFLLIQRCFIVQFSDVGIGSGIGLGSSYGGNRQCLLSEYGGLSENDLRRDENFEVWEYRGGDCRSNRNGMNMNKTMS